MTVREASTRSPAHDPAGNITRNHDPIDPGFGHDDLIRLVTANTGLNLWRTGSYSYDAMGNMMSLRLGEVTGPPDGMLRRPKTDVSTVPLGRVTSFAYQGTTPKLNVVTNNDLERPVTYDAAGNELTYAVERTYSARNLLASVVEPLEGVTHRIDYGYDGRGLRVKRSEPPAAGGNSTRYFVYSPELTLLSVTEDDAPNPWVRGPVVQALSPAIRTEIVWFAGRPLAQTTSTSLQYTFADHLGTPILQTAWNSATITWHAEHEPFGNVYEMRNGVRTEQPLRFPGPEVAMTLEGQEENYNVFRWYRAGWGRYTQSDPMGWVGQEYPYASENPISNTDRYGLFDTGSVAKEIVRRSINACGDQVGRAWGGPLVAALLSLANAADANPQKFEDQIKNCDKCKSDPRKCAPCIPPVGTRAYREDTNPASPPHRGVPPPHWHLYEMQQSPPSAGCKCFWHPIPDNHGGFGASPAPPGTVPITPAAGGGIL